MPGFASIAPDKLARLIGTAKAPVVIDVREEMWRFFRRFTRPEATGLTAAAHRVDGRS